MLFDDFLISTTTEFPTIPLSNVIDLAWLTPLWMPGLIPLLLPPSPGCQVPNSPQNEPRWAPFLMRQETLIEYKSLHCIRLPSSTGDGGRRDKQKPAFQTSVVIIDG